MMLCLTLRPLTAWVEAAPDCAPMPDAPAAPVVAAAPRSPVAPGPDGAPGVPGAGIVRFSPPGVLDEPDVEGTVVDWPDFDVLELVVPVLEDPVPELPDCDVAELDCAVEDRSAPAVPDVADSEDGVPEEDVLAWANTGDAMMGSTAQA